MPELNTVPNFTFNQGDPFAGAAEYPIEVIYYNGSISLEQNGNAIILSNDHYKSLFKEVSKHFNEAQQALK